MFAQQIIRIHLQFINCTLNLLAISRPSSCIHLKRHEIRIVINQSLVINVYIAYICRYQFAWAANFIDM